MGQKDIVENNLLVKNDIFADVANGLIFHGKQIIKPEDLEDAEPRSVYTANNGKIHRQERDVSKYWKKCGFVISLLNVENQTKEEGDMPFRVIGYDGASYNSEMHDKRHRYHYPVITLVLYYGKTHWKHSRNLIDLLDIPEYLKDVEDEIKAVTDKFVMDGLFEISFLKPEELNWFRSDYRIVADYFVQSRTNKKYKPSSQEIKHVNEILDFMNVMTHKDWNSEYIEMLKEKGEPITMVSAYKEIIEKSEAKGRNEGISIGESRGISIGRNEGRMETASRMLADGMPEDKVIKYSGLSADEVMKLSKQK